MFQVLLRQEHHDKGSRQTVRLQVRLPRPHASLPDPEPRSRGRGGLRVQVPLRVRALLVARVPAVPQTERAAVTVGRSHPGLVGAPAVALRGPAVGILEPQLRHDHEQPVKPVRDRFFRIVVGASATSDDVGTEQPQIRRRRIDVRRRVVSDRLEFGDVGFSSRLNVFHVRGDDADDARKIFGTLSRLSHLARSRFRVRDDPLGVETPPSAAP